MITTLSNCILINKQNFDMNTRDELKEMIVNNAASWRKEENTDDMAEIYVDDFLNELLGKFKLLPIQNASNLLPCPFCGGEVEDEVVQWNISQAKCTECDETWGTCGSKYEGRFNKWNVRAPKSK